MRWDGDPHHQDVVGKVNGMPDVENALMGISPIAWAAALASGRRARGAIIRMYFQDSFALHERASENI